PPPPSPPTLKPALSVGPVNITTPLGSQVTIDGTRVTVGCNSAFLGAFRSHLLTLLQLGPEYLDALACRDAAAGSSEVSGGSSSSSSSSNSTSTSSSSSSSSNSTKTSSSKQATSAVEPAVVEEAVAAGRRRLQQSSKACSSPSQQLYVPLRLPDGEDASLYGQRIVAALSLWAFLSDASALSGGGGGSGGGSALQFCVPPYTAATAAASSPLQSDSSPPPQRQSALDAACSGLPVGTLVTLNGITYSCPQPSQPPPPPQLQPAAAAPVVAAAAAAGSGGSGGPKTMSVAAAGGGVGALIGGAVTAAVMLKRRRQQRRRRREGGSASGEEESGSTETESLAGDDAISDSCRPSKPATPATSRALSTTAPSATAHAAPCKPPAATATAVRPSRDPSTRSVLSAAVEVLGLPSTTGRSALSFLLPSALSRPASTSAHHKTKTDSSKKKRRLGWLPPGAVDATSEGTPSRRSTEGNTPAASTGGAPPCTTQAGGDVAAAAAAPTVPTIAILTDPPSPPAGAAPPPPDHAVSGSRPTTPAPHRQRGLEKSPSAAASCADVAPAKSSPALDGNLEPQRQQQHQEGMMTGRVGSADDAHTASHQVPEAACGAEPKQEEGEESNMQTAAAATEDSREADEEPEPQGPRERSTWPQAARPNWMAVSTAAGTAAAATGAADEATAAAAAAAFPERYSDPCDPHNFILRLPPLRLQRSTGIAGSSLRAGDAAAARRPREAAVILATDGESESDTSSPSHSRVRFGGAAPAVVPLRAPPAAPVLQVKPAEAPPEPKVRRVRQALQHASSFKPSALPGNAVLMLPQPQQPPPEQQQPGSPCSNRPAETWVQGMSRIGRMAREALQQKQQQPQQQQLQQRHPHAKASRHELPHLEPILHRILHPWGASSSTAASSTVPAAPVASSGTLLTAGGAQPGEGSPASGAAVPGTSGAAEGARPCSPTAATSFWSKRWRKTVHPMEAAAAAAEGASAAAAADAQPEHEAGAEPARPRWFGKKAAGQHQASGATAAAAAAVLAAAGVSAAAAARRSSGGGAEELWQRIRSHSFAGMTAWGSRSGSDTERQRRRRRKSSGGGALGGGGVGDGSESSAAGLPGRLR
ncbi:hypothetical protein Agub_g778, partial [Astrephomene gubernaculifera]